MDKATLNALVREDLRLEFESARVLQANLAVARNRIHGRIAANPNDLFSVRLGGVLDTYLREFEANAIRDLPIERALNRGTRVGHQIVGDAARVYKGARFWNFTPLLPLNAIAFETTQAAATIKRVSDSVRNQILRQVQIGIASGATTRQILDDVLGVGLRGERGRDGVFRSASVRAETIGRTVSNELINRGAHITYTQIDNLVPELELNKVWQTVGDDRTSDRCLRLAGQRRPLNDNFDAGDGWIGMFPPSHPNCRSRITSVSKRYQEQWDSRFPSP